MDQVLLTDGERLNVTVLADFPGLYIYQLSYLLIPDRSIDLNSVMYTPIFFCIDHNSLIYGPQTFVFFINLKAPGRWGAPQRHCARRLPRSLSSLSTSNLFINLNSLVY